MKSRSRFVCFKKISIVTLLVISFLFTSIAQASLPSLSSKANSIAEMQTSTNLSPFDDPFLISMMYGVRAGEQAMIFQAQRKVIVMMLLLVAYISLINSITIVTA